MVNIKEYFKDIDKPRTSLVLKEYVLTKHEDIFKSSILKKLYRLRKGLFEKFQSELIPLYLYSQLNKDYSEKVYYQLVLGSQQYDAIVIAENEIHKLEFSEYFDGNSHYKDMEQLSINGFSEFEIEDCFAKEKDFLLSFESNVIKKCEKGYDNVHIIFVITPYRFDFLPSDEIQPFFAKLITIIRKYDFKNNEVSILIKNGVITDELVSQLYDVF